MPPKGTKTKDKNAALKYRERNEEKAMKKGRRKKRQDFEVTPKSWTD